MKPGKFVVTAYEMLMPIMRFNWPTIDGRPPVAWYTLILPPPGASVSRGHVDDRRVTRRRVHADHMDRVAEAGVGVGASVVAECEEVERRAGRIGEVGLGADLVHREPCGARRGLRRPEREPRRGEGSSRAATP